MKRSILVIVLIVLVAVNFSILQAQTLPTPVQCGAVITGETNVNTPISQGWYYQEYSVELGSGDALTVTIAPIGQTTRTDIYVYDPASTRIANSTTSSAGQPTAVRELVVGATGQYTIRAWTDSVGAYSLTIDCILSNGTEINSTGNSNTTQNTNETEFTGFGFPGVGAVDFSAGVELPLTLGTPQTAPVGGDIVALYTIDAAAGQVSTLTLSRVSGELSIGVAVINSSTNDIIFFGGMPSSDNLSVELTFPEAGSYAIGLFALDTDTSGAVQITLE